jgi:hypothetical protein
MSEAVAKWWKSLDTGGDAKGGNNYLPKLWGLDSTNPNESCGASLAEELPWDTY